MPCQLKHSLTTRGLISRVTASLVVAFSLSTALAGPASPDPIKLKQPNGTVLHARIMGDEFQGWIETLEGYTILQDAKTGVWEYAVLEAKTGRLQSSGQPVVDPASAPSSLEKHLRPARNTQHEKWAQVAFREARSARLAPQSKIEGVTAQAGGPELAPVSGTRKLLIVLVNFSDRALSTSAANWDAKVFQTGAGVKSVRQFFKDNSINTLDIQPVPHTQAGNPQGIVTVTLTTAHPNYGKDYDYATETAWLNAALAQAATHVDFSSLDTSGNGVITPEEASIYFIPAGYDASGTTKTPNIWAHAWGGSLTAGSKTVNRWAMNGELNSADRQHPMGVIAHELGHSLTGLPDLYNTNSATSSTNNGLGRFSLMAGGSWGRESGEDGGTTPVSLDAWCRLFLGWTTPVTPTTQGELVTLGTSLSGTAASAKLVNPALSTQEFWLVENRYPTGWDKGLNGWFGTSWGGLLVMHIDEAIATNAYSGSGHQKVMAEHANNAAYGSVGTAGSLFNAGGNASFTPATSPSSDYYSGLGSTIGLNSTSATSTTMTFNMVKITDSTPPTGKPTAPAATTTEDTLTFNWTVGTAADPDSGISGYRLQVGTTPGGSDIFNGVVGNALSKTVTDLGMRDGVPLYGRVLALNGAGQEGAYSDNSTGYAIALPVFDGTVVNNSNLAFKTIGPWTSDASAFTVGPTSAKSATILDDSRTYLQAKLTGPGTLTFDWRVSCEAPPNPSSFYDNLAFSIDGVVQKRIGGDVTWDGETYELTAGPHIVRWTYTKDQDTIAGSDAGWVDDVQWAAQAGPTATINRSTYTTVPGDAFTYSATVANYVSNSNVNWTINNGGGSFSPTTTASGANTTFTAGVNPGSYTITATPVEAPNTPGTTSLTLVNPDTVTVTLSANPAVALTAAPVTLTPSVSQLTNPGVSWSASPGGYFNGQSGVSASWSSNVPGVYTLTATSLVATGRSGSTTVTVIDPTAINLTVSPINSKTLLTGGTFTFTATGDQGGGVNWSVNGGAAINTGGVLTLPTVSPLTGGTFTVTATSKLDPSKSATTTFTLKSMDLDHSGAVDAKDLLVMAQEWGLGTGAASNLLGIGTVDDTDLAALLAKL